MSTRRKWASVYRWIWVPLVVPALLFLAKEAYTGWLAPKVPWSAKQPSPESPGPRPEAKGTPPPVVKDREPVVIDDEG